MYIASTSPLPKKEHPPEPLDVGSKTPIPPVATMMVEAQQAGCVSPAYQAQMSGFNQRGDAVEMGGWAVHMPRSTGSRLILPFTESSFCGTTSGLDKGLPLPPQLAARGVAPEYWEQMCQRLEREVQRKAPSCCEYIFYYTTLIFLPCFCRKEVVYHRLLRHWLEDLNDELAPKGMYAKIQTNEITFPVDDDSTYHETISWLAIALTEEEVQRLQAEPVVYEPQWWNCSNVIEPSWCQKVYCCCGPLRAV